MISEDDDVAVKFGEETGELLTGDWEAEEEGGRGVGGKDDGELKF